MKKQFLIGIATLGVVAMVLSGCGEAPQKEIDEATIAIDSAKVVGADVYAPEAFLALQDSMKSTMEGVEAKKSKLFANFDDSKQKLTAIAAQASEVKALAETKKAELTSQIQATLAEVDELIANDKQLISEAPKGKEGATALVAIEGEITAIESSVAEVSSLVEKGDLQAALDKVNAAKEKASSIQTELQDVISKYQANKKQLIVKLQPDLIQT